MFICSSTAFVATLSFTVALDLDSGQNIEKYLISTFLQKKKFNYNKMLDFFFLPICYSSLLDWTFESRFFVESAPSARIFYSISDLSLFIGCNAISLEYKNSYHSDCVDVLLCFFCYLFICSIVVVMSLSFQVTYLRSVIITAFCLSKSA